MLPRPRTLAWTSPGDATNQVGKRRGDRQWEKREREERKREEGRN